MKIHVNPITKSINDEYLWIFESCYCYLQVLTVYFVYKIAKEVAYCCTHILWSNAKYLHPHKKIVIIWLLFHQPCISVRASISFGFWHGIHTVWFRFNRYCFQANGYPVIRNEYVIYYKSKQISLPKLDIDFQ